VVVLVCAPGQPSGRLAPVSEPTVDGQQQAVVPANEASWDDIRAVFGTDYASRCLCQRFKIGDRPLAG
jgi:hypothetical protein